MLINSGRMSHFKDHRDDEMYHYLSIASIHYRITESASRDVSGMTGYHQATLPTPDLMATSKHISECGHEEEIRGRVILST